MSGSNIKKIIAEIKPNAVEINGVHDMLKIQEKHFPEGDVQRIKSYIKDDKTIQAWDELLDVLKFSKEEAFEDYVNYILSCESKSPNHFKKVLINACREFNMEWLCGDLAVDGKDLF